MFRREGSSSGRRLYVQLWCSVFHVQGAFRWFILYYYITIQGAFCWFILYYYITIEGAKNKQFFIALLPNKAMVAVHFVSNVKYTHVKAADKIRMYETESPGFEELMHVDTLLHS